jgi:hypothetical protein
VTPPSPGKLITQAMVGTMTGGRKGSRALTITERKPKAPKKGKK